jgi:hypothetical protein
LARNRYGWQKRAKEMARKEKNDEKIKRRQGKALAPAAEEMPEAAADLGLGEPDPVESSLPVDS